MKWDKDLNDAWHENIPDLQKAFDAIKDIVIKRAEVKMKYEIEIEGLPEGWEPVAYRHPFSGEHYLFNGKVQQSARDLQGEYLIVKKKQPRRIVLEETEADNILPYQAFPGITLYNKEKIWLIVEDIGENKHMNMDNYSLEDLIKIHPRLCWVFDFGGKGIKYLKVVNKVVHGVNSTSHPTQYQVQGGGLYPDAMLASLESIKKYLHEVTKSQS